MTGTGRVVRDERRALRRYVSRCGGTVRRRRPVGGNVVVGGGPPKVAAVLAALALAAAACARTPAPAPAPAAPAGVDTGPSSLSARPSTFDRSTRPTLAPPKSLTLPPVVTRELPNGMKLVVVEQHELPIVDFILLVGTGAEADPAQRPGVATLTAELLDEGTATRNTLAIADQEAYLGVALQTASGWDASRVTLHTPTAQLDSALALFADVALRPTFPQREFDRVKRERLTELIQLKDRAPDIADRAYAAVLYGERHPYGHPLEGTETSVRLVGRGDVQRFYRTYYRPNNATLIAVGDVTPDDVERRARALFGAWERATVPAATVGAAPDHGKSAVYLIDKAGAPQTSVRIGVVGVPRSTDDYFALVVMNTILGGAFTSRLNQNLRETHGYTYGAFSSFDMRRAAGPFVARAEVTGAKTDSSLAEFMKELRGIRDTVPAVELEKAKRYLQLQLPARFETTGQIATQLVPLVLYGLPLDFYNGYVQRVEQITRADVQRVAQRYVNPDNFAIVIVGDRKSIEAPVRALGLGELSIRDMAGLPVAVP
jgi:zinc protease